MKNLKALLLHPFPHRISPHAASLRNKSNGWINEAYGSLPASLRKKLVTLNAAYWAGHCWPDAPLPLMESLTRMILWGVAYDDYYAPLQTGDLSTVTRRMMEVAWGAKPTAEENPIIHQFSIFMREFEMLATGAWMKRYINNMAEYFEGVEIDSRISYRKNIQYPSVAEYMPIRQKGMGCATISDLLELVSGILPDVVARHPFLLNARLTAGDLMGWGNDLMSVEKELRDDEGLNLVLVIQNEEKCSIETAFNEAVNMYNTQMKEYLRLCTNVPDLGPYTPSVKKFLYGQGMWLSGQLHWFDCTDRYKMSDRVTDH